MRNKKVDLKCDYCKKDIQKIPSHIYKTHFCNMECASKYKLGKKPWNIGLKMGPAWNKDKKIGKNYKLSETRKRLFAEGKIKTWNKNLTKENDARVKKYSENIKKTTRNSEWKNNLSKARKKLFAEGMINPMLGKKREDLRLRNLTPEYQRKCSLGSIKKPSKPEKKMIEIINKNNLNFSYVGDGKLWLKEFGELFNPDFINNNQIIEIYGDYWHNKPRAIEKDRKRIQAYKKLGYQPLIIWEKELVGKNKLSEEEILNKLNNGN